MSQAEPTLRRALLLPLFVALALAALVFRPASAPSKPARPPLPTPVAFDDLVPAGSVAPAAEPGQAPTTAEGLRSLKAH